MESSSAKFKCSRVDCRYTSSHGHVIPNMAYGSGGGSHSDQATRGVCDAGGAGGSLHGGMYNNQGGNSNMSKLKTKQDVIERYWPEYLHWCWARNSSAVRLVNPEGYVVPTEDNFWAWYISYVGPLGSVRANTVYSGTRREYA